MYGRIVVGVDGSGPSSAALTWALARASADDLPVLVGGTFEAGRPAGQTPGTALGVPLAINFSALPVEPDKSYLWRLAINDTSEPEWQRRFSVRSAVEA